jgi:hypothetical protein
MQGYDYTKASFPDNFLKQILASEYFLSLITSFYLDELPFLLVFLNLLARLPIGRFFIAFFVHSETQVSYFLPKFTKFKEFHQFLFLGRKKKSRNWLTFGSVSASLKTTKNYSCQISVS